MSMNYSAKPKKPPPTKRQRKRSKQITINEKRVNKCLFELEAKVTKDADKIEALMKENK